MVPAVMPGPRRQGRPGEGEALWLGWFRRQGPSSLTPNGATTARPVVTPRGQQLLVPRTVRNVVAGADVTLEDRAGTYSSTSTAAHSSSPSQDLSKLASSMAHLAICQPTCESAGQAGTGARGGFGPWYTSSPEPEWV